MSDDTVRECDRCQAIIPSTGLRCKRRTCLYYKYCFQHAQSILGLKIAKSSIPGAGKGLIATKTFRKGARIAEYGGDRLSPAEYNKTEGIFGLAVKKRNGVKEIIDAKSTQSGFGRWPNDCRAGDKRKKKCNGNNAKLMYVPRSDRAYVTASKRILPGSEVFTSYGGVPYWGKSKPVKESAIKTLPKEFAIKTIKKPIPNWVLQHKAAKLRDLANAKTAAKLKKARAKKRKNIESVWRIGTP